MRSFASSWMVVPACLEGLISHGIMSRGVEMAVKLLRCKLSDQCRSNIGVMIRNGAANLVGELSVLRYRLRRCLVGHSLAILQSVAVVPVRHHEPMLPYA